jgi:CMP-N-acetylneuraminic acid synthetase
MGYKILAVIPARGGSKSIHKKNISHLSGKPLIAWTIELAKRVNGISYIHISTDDKEIQNVAKLYGANCDFLRPKEISGDTDGTNQALVSSMLKLKELGHNYDYVMELQPTYCFRGKQIIEDVIKEILNNKNADSIVTCSQIDDTSHPDFALKVDIDGKIKYSKLKPDKFARQTLEKFYACKGIVMISKFDIFLDKKSFFSDRCYFFPIQNKLRMFDINYEEDLDLARIISKKYPTLLSE